MSAPPSPSGDIGGPEPIGPYVPRSLLLLVAVLLLVRLVLAANLHLTEDEAYYRLWAQRPALGYFDHPPMIAWWIWLGVRVAGDTALGVRLLAALACALTTILVFDIARLAGANGVDSRRAGVWHNATLLVAAGGFLAVPDAPAALFWVLCLWSVQHALRDGRCAWWLAAGVAAGLATLSKYSALFLGPGVLIWLVWTPQGRSSLRAPGPWLALVVAASLFAVNLGWNASHHWLTFSKQFGRIAPHRLAPRYLLEFLTTEFLLLNPFVAVFLFRRGKPARGDKPSVLPFVATSAPFIGYLLAHSLHDRIQAHWPAPVYPALAIIAAFAAGRARGPWLKLRAVAPGFAVAACVLGLVCLALPWTRFAPGFDPALPIRGWPVFATRLEDLRVANGATWIGTTSYGLAAELMDEPALAAPVLQISERDRWRGLVHGDWADTAHPGLLVDLPRRIDLAALRRCFAHVQRLPELARGAPAERGKPYAVLLVAGARRDISRAGCGGDGPTRPEAP